MLHVQYQPGEEAAFTRERCVELVRAAVGVEDLPVIIRNVLPWESAGRTATRWRVGRAFLVGDAAHVMPPTGAFGSNTGIQDAHNLAWKLALVLRGYATDALLDTYEQERLPVASATVAQAVLRASDRPRLAGRAGAPVPPGIVHDRTVIFQYRYESSAVVHTESERPNGPWVEHLDGTPGTRAPVSAFSSPGFVLVTGRTGADEWAHAADDAHRHTGLRIAVQLEDTDAYGISPEGAALIRPDGFMAWRTWRQPRDPANALVAVLSRVLYGGPDDLHWLDVTAPAAATQ
jgi:putative polyketide hydroxylase